ncbi:ribonuclease H-like domain-containing protein [Tanacetum coccineum]|uniref:Ribonuclease H-like domain-containing protein n=1 Tax=Tanacetum coccineum TaxID=301880 RepID=A0ABQ4XPN1_9ASTR
MVSTVKLPILKKGEYTLWSMRMKQYLTNTDYSLWQVILNGDGPIQVTTNENGVETEVPPKTAQALLQRQRERKAKSILLLAIPDENKDGIDDLDIDDLYNNLKVFEADIKGSSGLSSNSSNVTFLSTEDTSSSNEVNTANDLNSPQLDDKVLEQIDHDDLEEMDLKWSRDNTSRNVLVETSNALVVQDNALIVQDRLGYDWSYIAQDEPTEFCSMAYTSNSSGSDTELSLKENLRLEFEVERTKVMQTLTLKNQLDETLREKDDLKDKLEQFETSSKNLNKLINSQLSSNDKTGLGYRGQLNENDSSGRFKKDNGYHAIPPPLTGNYMPPLADLSFAGLDDSVYRPITNNTSASVSQVEKSTSQTSNTNVEMPRVESVRPSGVIIEDWVSDDDEDIFQSNDLHATDKPSFKRIEFTNARNESVKPKQAEKPRIITQNPKVDRRDWNGKMTQKLGLGFGFTKKASPNTRISNEKVNTVRVNGVNTAGQTSVGTVKGTRVTAVKASAEFKNREMNEFYGLKGIKREFSVVRTQQQNRVAERKNRTLIEAARTLLAELTQYRIVFWLKQLILLVIPPSISFMRPFGCPVTILNTIDPLGKFDGKAEEGFLVGYSINSKAFRVFNSQTKKVEDNLHVNFLENKPNVARQGPNWLFDIDSLTNFRNYQPVNAGNQTNKNAGPKEAKINEKEASEQSDAVRKEFEAQCNRQNLSGKTTRASSTNSFNTVSTPVNAAVVMC